MEDFILSDKNRLFLDMLRDIDEVNRAVGCKSYVWGGFAVDIFEGRFLREHGDLDLFTQDLLLHRNTLEQAYTERDYTVTFLDRFRILEIRRGEIHAGMNPLLMQGKTAQWQHIGGEGSLYFPVDWLDATPRMFYDSPAYLAGMRFEYAIKTKTALLYPPQERTLREKDKIAAAYWKKQLQAQGISPEEMLPRIWGYNPFWYELGYEEYYWPVL